MNGWQGSYSPLPTPHSPLPVYSMNFEEAIKYLYSLGNETLAMKLGLESVRALARALRDPQRKFPAVHIAGTNGKGSTSATTRSRRMNSRAWLLTCAPPASAL